jgi:hypothetical protein
MDHGQLVPLIWIVRLTTSLPVRNSYTFTGTAILWKVTFAKAPEDPLL